jgi:hypothetical protein
VQRSDSELLIFAIAVAVFLLFNFVMQRIARAARERQQREEPLQQQQEEEDPLENIWGRSPQVQTEPPRRPAAVLVAPMQSVDAVAAPRRAPPPVPGRRIPPAALFRSRQDLRHAIVVMTVLGPCRAQDPYQPR